MDNALQKIKNIPQKPGVYEFIDKTGGIIYIGKAKNLRARVRQYFAGSDGRPQIPFLLEDAMDITYTVVQTELESLYLENTLIKKHLPKYNIMLRDDKNYAFIKIDYSTQIPQISYARKIETLSPIPLSLKAKYFGPYSSAYKIKNTLNLARKIFPYCAHEKISSRPCFYYYLRRCPGVCIGKISLEEYQTQIEKIKLFLSGKTGLIKKELINEMRKLAKAKKFEAAARLRDQIQALEILEEKQIAIFAKKVDWDIVSFAKIDQYYCINLFKVRLGKLADKENFVYKINTVNVAEAIGLQKHAGQWPPLQTQESKILQTFLEQYYLDTSDLPGEIYLEAVPENISVIEKLLQTRANKKIKIIQPKKGKTLELVKLGQENAREYLKKYLIDQGKYLDEINQALAQLKDILHLENIPKRIECYDISNIQGTNAVGSMVVFENGKPAKNQYRKFKIQGKTTPDDFAMMKEMLSRRFARIAGKQEEPTHKNQINPNIQTPIPKQQTWPAPDLIVIDGGKGQLSAALSVLKPNTYNLKPIPIIGLAKRIEEIFVPGKSEPIILPHDQPALKLLQRLRDETHRFGITFHRALRSKQAIKSALDDISGLGPKTKKLLKQTFGTVANIRKAGMDEIKKITGQALAKKIKQNL